LRPPARRDVLKIVGLAAGGSAAAVLAPFVGHALIHRKTIENGGIVEVDVAQLPAGQLLTVDWQGRPVWILRRTPAMLASLAASQDLTDPASEHSQQPEYARNPQRSLVPELFVAIGLCTHLGCAPTLRIKPGSAEGMPVDWRGGFVCPCHSSSFDLAGRVHRNGMATENLAVPPYRLVDENRLRIGEDAAA
jgi:ubiquinol-cytochrome c reductase iron-sulfur subunit